MPDPTPVVPAPAAAAPATPASTPPPAPSPAPAAAQPEKTPNRKIAESLASLLTAKAPDPAAAPKKTEPAPAAPKETAKPKDEKPVKVAKKADPAPAAKETPPPVPKREPRAAAPAAQPAAQPAAAPAPAAKPEESDEEFDKKLLDEERALLEDAAAAEKYLPEKYKGQAAKQRAFLRENAAKAAAVEKGDLDEADYRKWHAAHLPKISPLDYRNIERQRITEDVRKDYEPKIAEESHARWVEQKSPEIKRRGDAAWTKLASSALPDEVSTAIAERTKGITDQKEKVRIINEVKEEYAMEFRVAEAVMTAATSDIEEFHRLLEINPATGKPIKARNTDLNSEEGQQHARIARMAHETCDAFKANGGPELRRDGKWFATWKEWNQMQDMVATGDLPREELSKWWTFGNDELADRALSMVKTVVTNSVAEQTRLMEAQGFKRVRAARVPATPAAPTPPGAPAAPRPSPPPAPGGEAPASFGSRMAGKLLG